ncbi:prolyl-tRNA synthetase [Candidatus Saccharibacteria bacterium]|nr:prolyl-tRNA synthetase [Candidatus Saccharibacteria bacterium]
MRLSHNFTKTRRDAPKDETARNAQLLIRAGYVHKMMAGVYAYLPLGKLVLDNIAQIVREEMNAVGGQEVQMTVLQPKELWEKTDRWDDKKVDNWFKTKLANGTEVGVGLSHEEPIVDSLKAFVGSYKDLPITIYQIQSKFRNELRAKSGLLRGREFIMKDMYTFAQTQEEHTKLYEQIAEAYIRIFERLGLGDSTYRTYADGGYFTEKFSDEFQTVSPIGEDTIYVDEKKRIAINKEIYTDENLAKLNFNRADLVEKRGVEVGNIFPLESKYSDALDLYYVDEKGQRQSIIMGCYGIGISRLVGMIAEHFADDNGLVWPASIAPAEVHLVALGTDAEIVAAADDLYHELTAAGHEVIYDDRDVQAGLKFADADLMGMPLRITVSKKTLAEGSVEFKARTEEETRMVKLADVITAL